MISDKIKKLFKYIDFLHFNIDNFIQYNDDVNEINLLRLEREKLKAHNNFKEKLKYDDVQKNIKKKLSVIEQKVMCPVREKAEELKICNFQNEPLYTWYGIESEIFNLKGNFNNDDLPEIFSHKNKYLEFRLKTNCSYFLDLFFRELDDILKDLFFYFKESENNEFEEFETGTMTVESIQELAQKLCSNKTPQEEANQDIYNGMFTVSDTKINFRLNNGSIQRISNHSTTFDLENLNTYNKKTGDLEEIGSMSSYCTSFMIRFFYMTVLEVKPFLTHQLRSSKNPKALIEYVKYAVLDSKSLTSEGMIKAINDWLEELTEEETKNKTTFNEIPEVELRFISEQIRLLEDLGVLDFLKGKYPNALNSENQLAKLVSKLIKQKQGSIQPIINAVKGGNANKNYPKESTNTKSIMDWLNSYE